MGPAMKRHPALQDLSRDHYQVLILCQNAEKALAGEAGAPAPREAAEDLAAAWEEDIRLHLREEEDVLLPILARHGPVTGIDPVPRVVDDHAWFRDRFPALADALEEGDDDAVEELLEAVAGRLRRHARLEEDELFQRAQELLTEADLEDLAQAGRAFRREHRGPDAVGPDRPSPTRER